MIDAPWLLPDPERDRRRGTVDKHPADIGGPRQQILDEAPALRIEPQDAVAQHRAGPRVAVPVQGDIVAIHSAFESWAARFDALTSFRSIAVPCGKTVAVAGPPSSYPTARMPSE